MLLLNEKSLVVNYDVQFQNSEMVRKRVIGQIERLLENPQFIHVEETLVFGEQFFPNVGFSKKDIDSPMIIREISDVKKIMVSETINPISYQVIKITKINYATPFTLAFILHNSMYSWIYPKLNKQQAEYFLHNYETVDTNTLAFLLRNKEKEKCLEELESTLDVKLGESYDVFNHLLAKALPDVTEFVKAFQDVEFYNPRILLESTGRVKDIALAKSNSEIIKKLGLKPKFIK